MHVRLRMVFKDPNIRDSFDRWVWCGIDHPIVTDGFALRRDERCNRTSQLEIEQRIIDPLIGHNATERNLVDRKVIEPVEVDLVTGCQPQPEEASESASVRLGNTNCSRHPNSVPLPPRTCAL